MKGPTWEVHTLFWRPVYAGDVTLSEAPLVTPRGVDELVRKSWDKQLEERRAALRTSGQETESRPYQEDPSPTRLNALYHTDGRPVMWPGPVVTMTGAGYDGDSNKAALHVGQTSFPCIKAVNDPVVRALYEREGIPVPRPALGICTLPITADDKIVLTVRGPGTPMYPGRFYAPGGQPLHPGTNVEKHQLEEMEEEILIAPTEVAHQLTDKPDPFEEGMFLDDPDRFNMFFGGVVVDTEQQQGKPDLVGWVDVISSEVIQKRVRERPKGRRPKDAIGVVFAPATQDELFEYMRDTVHPINFCPPAHAALLVYGHHMFGESWANDLLKELETA